MKLSHALGDRVAHLAGRHKPFQGGKAYAIQAADTREMSTPAPLQEARLSFIGNQISKKHSPAAQPLPASA